MRCLKRIQLRLTPSSGDMFDSRSLVEIENAFRIFSVVSYHVALKSALALVLRMAYELIFKELLFVNFPNAVSGSYFRSVKIQSLITKQGTDDRSSGPQTMHYTRHSEDNSDKPT